MRMFIRSTVAAFLLMAMAAMAWPAANSITPTGKLVWPTRNDVATTSLEGRSFGERIMTNVFSGYFEKNFSVTGLTAPASSTNQYLTISAGTAFINGYFAKVTTNTIVAFPAAGRYCAYLEIPVSSNLATDLQYTTNTTCTAPSTNSFLILSATATSTSITSAVDLRVMSPYIKQIGAFHVFDAEGTGTWTPGTGTTRVFVELVGGGGAGGGDSAAGGNGGGGGGAGEYRVGWLDVSPGIPVPYTVGSRGLGSAGANGGDGTASSFGPSGGITISALPGLGGKSDINGGAGGAGGGLLSFTHRNYGIIGLNGGSDTSIDVPSIGAGTGQGGRSFFTTGGPRGNPGAGTAGLFGSGGGGAVSSGASVAGGNGGYGVLIIHF